METLERILEFVSDVFDIVEQFLLGLVAKTATWLSPMVPAIFIYSSIQVHFGGLPEWSNYLIAYVIEALGLTTIMNTMEGWQHWQRERTRAHGWVLGIAGATALFYVVLNILLVIVLKVHPGLAPWGTGLLSTLSVVAGISTVMRVWQSQRASEIRRELRQQEQERREARQMETDRRQQEFTLELELKRAEHEQRLEIERQKVAAKLSKSVAKTVAIPVAETPIGNTNTPAISENATQRRNVLLNLLQQHGDVGDTEFGRKLGVDRTTVYRDFQALAKNRLVHKNGHGWEVNKDAAH